MWPAVAVLLAPMTKSIKVLHVLETFLHRTEVFIYSYLNEFINAEPHVLASVKQNAEEFPFTPVTYIPRRRPWTSVSRWLSAGYHMKTGRSLQHAEIETFVRALKPDVIHAHFGPSGYDMLRYRRHFDVPLVTTFYGYDMSRLPRKEIWQVQYAKLFAEGDLFLVEGPHMRQKLLDIGAPEGKTAIQRIAIHPGRYPAWRPAGDRAVILFVGRFTEKKGLLYALKAVQALRERVRNIEFRIVGDGSQRDDMYRFVADNNMQGCVTFLGMRTHDEVIRELSEANVFICPSVTAEDGDSEGGAPTILLEAQAIGLPIVSTCHADIPNVVGGGPGISLCNERDADCLAEAVWLALESKVGARPDFVREFHDVRKEVLLLEEKYFALIAGSRRSELLRKAD